MKAALAFVGVAVGCVHHEGINYAKGDFKVVGMNNADTCCLYCCGGQVAESDSYVFSQSRQECYCKKYAKTEAAVDDVWASAHCGLPRESFSLWVAT